MAQKVKIAQDGTVTADGEEVFKIIGKNSIRGASYSVYNLSGELLIGADGSPSNNFLTLTFRESNIAIDYPMSIGFKKYFAKELLQMGVIQNGQLNPQNVKRLVAKYQGRVDPGVLLTEGNSPNTIIVNQRTPLVARNRQADFYLKGEIIYQDGTAIGKIHADQITEQGKVLDRFIINNLEGNVLAEVYKAMGEKEVTFMLPEQDAFSIQIENAMMDTYSLRERIVDELIQGNYL